MECAILETIGAIGTNMICVVWLLMRRQVRGIRRSVVRTWRAANIDVVTGVGSGTSSRYPDARTFIRRMQCFPGIDSPGAALEYCDSSDIYHHSTHSDLDRQDVGSKTRTRAYVEPSRTLMGTIFHLDFG